MSSLLLFGGAAALTAGGLSARWNWWRKPVDGIPVLMYHKVGTPPKGSKLGKLWVSNEKFRQQMEIIKAEGFTPIVFKDIYQHWDHNKNLPPKPLLITFDDGYENNYTEAFPILKSFGFPATLFVVVQTVGWENQWHDPKSEIRIKMISWSQLKELQSSGWEIGSHTMNHHNLQKIELKEVQLEMEKSRRILAEFMGEAPDTFAYPYGSGEDNVAIRQKAKEAGYRIAVGVHAGKWTLDRFQTSPFNLPRVFVRGDENMLDFRLQLSRGQSRL